MSPIKPRGPAVPPSPPKPKVDDVDQTIAEPPRDFTEEIFRELVGNAPPPAPRPAAGAPPPPLENLVNTVPLAIELEPITSPKLSNTKPMVGAPAHPQHAPFMQPPPAALPPAHPIAPPSPAVHVQAGPPAAPIAAAKETGEVRVRTPLWALVYLGLAVLAIAFGLFVLFMQSRVAGHF